MTRNDLIGGLRQLADYLEERPDLSVGPIYSGKVTVGQFVDADELRAAARQMGRASKRYSSAFFELSKSFGNGAVKFEVNTERKNICERRVISSKKVVVEKPDPEYIAKAPVVSVEETIDEVEWICEPSILAATA